MSKYFSPSEFRKCTPAYDTSTSAYDYSVTIEDAAPANTNEATE